MIGMASLVFMLAGVVMVVVAQTMRTSEHPPIGSLNYKNWKPIWMTRGWFTPKGYKYHITGWVVLFIGMGLLLVKILG